MAGGDKGFPRTPEAVRDVGRAYGEYSDAVGHRIEYIYQLRRTAMDPSFVDAAVVAFPAVWGWTSSEENGPFWAMY